MGSQDFNVLTEEIKSSRLIEASAGTGKTFSIAVLALRLIIEKEIPIEKILMVTFTKAAVAEMESRIRKFIRIGYKYIHGKLDLPENDKIRKVIENSGISSEKKMDLLRNAVQGLDNLSVMTIHSFCQQTINEFTFETRQSFDFEIETDDSELLKKAANKYLREVLNIMDLDKFREIEKDIKFENMYELLRKYLQGMTFIDSNTLIELSGIEQNEQQKKEALRSQIEKELSKIKQVDINNRTELGRNRGSADLFMPQFIKHCCVKKNYEYIKLFDFIYYDYGKEYTEAIELKNITYLNFFKKSEELIKSIKESKGHIYYDDQIKTIHNALGNKTFTKKLAGKYRAVFIDEFQDTDQHQYEIFKTVFSEDPDDPKISKDPEKRPVIFYIGDPKQSIYGWRGADLETYKDAKEDVGDEGILRMNTNYRSTKNMIDALNKLLNPGGDFNMFIDDKIRYHNVEQGAAALGRLVDNGKEAEPLTIWSFNENDEKSNFKAVALEILRLLTKDVKIEGRKNATEKLIPRDIGVLVRDNREGDAIKKELAKLDIPAVKRDNKKVLESDEARMLKYLLTAVISPNRGDINRALLSPYFGFRADDIKTLDDEQHIEVFIGLKKTLNEEGIYNMISAFLNIYGIRSACMKDVLGQRVLTNISHIAEILHRVEKQLKYTPDELLVWIQRSIEDGNEEFEQRVESDEDAVQISTIHKAKGLEYNIVFAPCLCMLPRFKQMEKNKVNDFKKGGKYYFTFDYSSLAPEDKELFKTQKEQENRRLIYVALTRPVYKCYISYMPRTYFGASKVSSMDDIYNAYTNKIPDLIKEEDLTHKRFGRISGKYDPDETDKKEFCPKPVPILEIKNTFNIHSYSALSSAHHSTPFEKKGIGDNRNYDQFIFQELRRGANVGTALHSIFERLTFNDHARWDKTLLDASKFYRNIIKEGNLDHFRTLVDHVMKTEINCNGDNLRLSDIPDDKKLPELEFLFSVDKVNRQVVNEYLGEDAKLGGDSNIEGLMTGFIDLVFEHNGKYYILDWKSNYLGNSTYNYDRNSMEEAMIRSNYHLQYMIYTVALKRWLEKRISGFDFDKNFGGVIYVFLRGVREGMETGIYTNRPDKEKIEKLDNALKNIN